MSSMNKRTTKMMLSASSLGAGSAPSPKMPLVAQEPWTLARLHGVVKNNVCAFEHGKHGIHRPQYSRPTPLRVQFLNRRATFTFNNCINAWTSRHYDEFGEDHLYEKVLCPHVSTQAAVQPSECSGSEFSGSEFPSVPSECSGSECYDDEFSGSEFSGSEFSGSEFSGSELSSVPSECSGSECYDDEFSGSEFSGSELSSVPSECSGSECYDLKSYEYFKEGAHTEFHIIGEDDTHAEFPDEEKMATAFDNVHMLMLSDGVYMLPTQPGFDMSASSQSTAEHDFGDIAVLNPEDEQTFAKQFAEQSAEQFAEQFANQLDDQLFDRYMLAFIQANGILHAMDGTSPSMEEFFVLQDLVNRVLTNTTTEADKRYVACILSIINKIED